MDEGSLRRQMHTIKSIMIARGASTPPHVEFQLEETPVGRRGSTARPPPFYVHMHSGKIHAFWMNERKLGISDLRLILDSHEQDEDTHFIFVAIYGATPFTEKYLKTYVSASHITVFRGEELEHDITKHVLVPNHRACDEEETERILMSLNCTKAQLPALYTTDPVAKYYGFRTQQVVAIDRNWLLPQSQIFYRVVINPESTSASAPSDVSGQ